MKPVFERLRPALDALDQLRAQNYRDKLSYGQDDEICQLIDEIIRDTEIKLLSRIGKEMLEDPPF